MTRFSLRNTLSRVSPPVEIITHTQQTTNTDAKAPEEAPRPTGDGAVWVCALSPSKAGADHGEAAGIAEA
eukprot:7687839-Pyramimonas_sp.AAC.1